MNARTASSAGPSRLPAYALTVASSAVILMLTLWPNEPRPGAIGSLCVICGSRGTADAILNVFLFVPLGIGFGLLRGWRAAALTAFLLSCSVELAQTFLPGRFPTLGDVIFNTAGGALGGAILPFLAAVPDMLRDPSRTVRFAARAAAALLLVLPVLLLGPRFPETDWYGQWTPDLGHMEVYGGQVLDAFVGDVPVPPGRLVDAEPVRSALASGQDIRVRFVTGAPPSRVAPVFAVYDGDQRQILMVGVEGNAVVYYRRSGAATVALDHPGLAWPGALEGPPGDTVSLRIERRRSGVCLELEGRGACGAGFGAGDGWRLLMNPGPVALPALAFTLLGFIWTAVLAMPAGGVARSPTSALGAGFGLGLLAMGAAWLVPELAAHPLTPIGTTLGALAGWVAARGFASKGGGEQAAQSG